MIARDKEQTTIRLPSELKAQLKEQAEIIGIGFNELIILILNSAISEKTVSDQIPAQKLQYDEE